MTFEAPNYTKTNFSGALPRTQGELTALPQTPQLVRRDLLPPQQTHPHARESLKLWEATRPMVTTNQKGAKYCTR